MTLEKELKLHWVAPSAVKETDLSLVLNKLSLACLIDKTLSLLSNSLVRHHLICRGTVGPINKEGVLSYWYDRKNNVIKMAIDMTKKL